MKFLKMLLAAAISLPLMASAVSGKPARAKPTPAPAKRATHKKPVSPVPKSASIVPVTDEKPLNAKFEVALTAAYSVFLSRNDKTLWPVGITAGVWAGYFLEPRALVGVRMDYFYSGGDAGNFAQQFQPGYTQSAEWGTSSASMNVTRFIPSMKFNLNPVESSPVQPHVVVGAGFMNKSMSNGSIHGENGMGAGTSTDIVGYSTTVAVLSVSAGLPILLPHGFKIPLEFELSTGFTSPQNTSMQSISAGLCRDW